MAEADEIIRKRELRRRKILENAESRLKKISGLCGPLDNKTQTIEKDGVDSEISGTDFKNCSASAKTSSQQRGGANFCQSSIPLNSLYSSEDSFDLSTGDSSPTSANGVFGRSSFDESYIFPKKVSDAETRSFGRARADSRRNSSCTQIMMERLHYSYFRLSVLRPWIVILAAVLTRICFALSYLSSAVENIFLPFAMLESALQLWAKLESQVSSRQSQPSVFTGVLMLSGISPSVISILTDSLKLVQNLLQDLAVYVFTFVVLHFICENYVS